MHPFVRAGAPLALALALAAPARAEDAVVVTATRTETMLRESLPHTTVITAREIRDAGVVDLPGLLRREAGFELTQTGGIGNSTGTFLRGAATNQVLVLIDGVRVSSLTTGTSQLDQLMLDQIERVEIVRGNVSSLYGSGAIGGVIQVFTRQGAGAPRASAEFTAGGNGLLRLRAGYAGEIDGTRFSLNVSSFATAGFSAIRPEIRDVVNPDRDGYRNRSVTANLAHRFAPGHEAGARLFLSEGRVDFDNAFAARSTDVHRGETEVGAFSLYTHNRLAARWLSRLSLSAGRDGFDNETNFVPVSRTRTRNTQTLWQNDLIVSEAHTLTLGLERLEQQVASTTAYRSQGRTVEAQFAGWQGRFGAHALQLNVRSEAYSDFGRARTGFAAYGYDLSSAWRLIASTGRAFRAPTFNELFFPGFGNPALRPERSHSMEAGVQYAAGGQIMRLVVFRAEIFDAISGSPPVNVNAAEVNGLESAWRGMFAGFEVRASLTHQDPVQRAGGVETQLIRRARTHGSLALSRSFGPWRFNADLLASGARFDNHLVTSQRLRLEGYQVMNLSASYRFAPGSEFALRLDNVFDRGYELTHGYAVQRRLLSFGVRHVF